MHDGGDFRQFVCRVAAASRPEKTSWLRFRESVDTMILGTLSTSLGVIVLVLGLLAVLGVGRIGWTEHVRGRAGTQRRVWDRGGRWGNAWRRRVGTRPDEGANDPTSERNRYHYLPYSDVPAVWAVYLYGSN